MEVQFSNPTRWIVKLIDKPRIAAWPREHSYLFRQPSVQLGGNPQATRFAERGTPPFSHRQLAGFRDDLCRAFIPYATVGAILCILFHGRYL
jgi:hypothetical protein